MFSEEKEDKSARKPEMPRREFPPGHFVRCWNLLGDGKGAGNGGRQIVAAQDHYRHNIAARLCGRGGGAGIQLPFIGETRIQIMDTALVNCYIAIIGQGYAKVKILGLLTVSLPPEIS